MRKRCDAGPVVADLIEKQTWSLRGVRRAQAPMGVPQSEKWRVTRHPLACARIHIRRPNLPRPEPIDEAVAVVIQGECDRHEQRRN